MKLTGAFVVVLSLMGAIFCGFFANAETVTTASTEYSYVTDVSGAFVGDSQDIATDYSPASNLTGYSVFAPGTAGVDRIPGIEYREANPNPYWIQTTSGSAKTLSVGLEAVKSSSALSAGYAILTYGGATSAEGARPLIDASWGLKTSELTTVATIGQTVHYASCGISLGAYMQALKAVYKVATSQELAGGLVYLGFPGGDAAGYPGFIADPEWRIDSSPGHLSAVVGYSAVGSEAVVDLSSYTASIGSATYNLDQVCIIWGGTSDAASSDIGKTATMQAIVGAETRTSYMDPRAGVTPVSQTVTTTEIIREVTASSAVSGFFSYPRTVSEYFAYDKVFLDGVFVLGVQIVMGSNGAYIVAVFSEDFGDPSGPTSGTPVKTYTGTVQSGYSANVFWSWDGSHPSLVAFSSGTSKGAPSEHPAYTDSASSGISSSEISAVSTAHRYSGARLDSWSLVTEIRDDTHDSVSRVLNAPASLDTAVISTRVVEAVQTYTSTYWTNGYANASVSVLLRAPSVGISTVWTILDDNGGIYEFPISATTSGSRTSWAADGADIGQYPAVILTWSIDGGKIHLSAQRVTLFSDMQSYKLVGIPVPLSVHGFNGISIQSIRFDTSSPEFTHEIIGTTVIVPNGGMYIHNGVFSPAARFPEVGILKFKISSVAHRGDSMTINPEVSE